MHPVLVAVPGAFSESMFGRGIWGLQGGRGPARRSATGRVSGQSLCCPLLPQFGPRSSSCVYSFQRYLVLVSLMAHLSLSEQYLQVPAPSGQGVSQGLEWVATGSSVGILEWVDLMLEGWARMACYLLLGRKPFTHLTVLPRSCGN